MYLLSFLKTLTFKGIHAREWIAPAVALYIVKKLAEYHPAYLKDNLTVHIIPLLNPDGYEFSRTNVSLTVLFYWFLVMNHADN